MVWVYLVHFLLGPSALIARLYCLWCPWTRLFKHLHCHLAPVHSLILFYIPASRLQVCMLNPSTSPLPRGQPIAPSAGPCVCTPPMTAFMSFLLYQGGGGWGGRRLPQLSSSLQFVLLAGPSECVLGRREQYRTPCFFIL